VSPLLWFIVLAAAPAIPLPQPFKERLYSSFPLRLGRVQPGESRLTGFIRIIFASVLFGCIVGLLGGATFMAVRELLSYLFSK
jgi:hypothetical protein